MAPNLGHRQTVNKSWTLKGVKLVLWKKAAHSTNMRQSHHRVWSFRKASDSNESASHSKIQENKTRLCWSLAYSWWEPTGSIEIQQLSQWVLWQLPWWTAVRLVSSCLRDCGSEEQSHFFIIWPKFLLPQSDKWDPFTCCQQFFLAWFYRPTAKCPDSPLLSVLTPPWQMFLNNL